MAHEEKGVWEVLSATYDMYIFQGLHVTMIAGGKEFSWPQYSAPHQFWPERQHHKIVGLSNVTSTSWRKCFVQYATAYHLQPYRVSYCLYGITYHWICKWTPLLGWCKVIRPYCCIHDSNVASLGINFQVSGNVQPQDNLALRTRAATFVGRNKQSCRWYGLPCIGYWPHYF